MGVDLSTFQPDRRVAQRARLVQIAWRCAIGPVFSSTLLYGSGWRIRLLRLFGASIGKKVEIKPGVQVRYPWKLVVGDHSWIGEGCWIDNLAVVTIGANVCISQGSYLCTGNHDWRDTAFRTYVQPIVLQDGCWIAARSTLAPGVTVGRDAIAGIGSVVVRDIPASEIHTGNPAQFLRLRTFYDTIPDRAAHVPDQRSA